MLYLLDMDVLIERLSSMSSKVLWPQGEVTSDLFWKFGLQEYLYCLLYIFYTFDFVNKNFQEGTSFSFSKAFVKC